MIAAAAAAAAKCSIRARGGGGGGRGGAVSVWGPLKNSESAAARRSLETSVVIRDALLALLCTILVGWKPPRGVKCLRAISPTGKLTNFHLYCGSQTLAVAALHFLESRIHFERPPVIDLWIFSERRRRRWLLPPSVGGGWSVGILVFASAHQRMARLGFLVRDEAKGKPMEEKICLAIVVVDIQGCVLSPSRGREIRQSQH